MNPFETLDRADMNWKQTQVIGELERIKGVVAEAERDRKLIEYRDGDVIFTPAQLVDQVRQGNWWCVDWTLVSRREYGDRLRESLKEATEKYHAFVNLLEAEE